MNNLILYFAYAILICLLFENFKVFNSVQKSFKGVDPMVVKIVVIIVGVYTTGNI